MWMPQGVHHIVCSWGDKDWDGYVECRKGDEAKLNKALASHANNGHKPFFDFDHKGGEASAWPKRFLWQDMPQPGIYVEPEWSDAGLQAVTGKRFRGFSPGFFPENFDETSEEEPTRILSAPANMGGLTNLPAFRTIRPLWAKEQISSKRTEAAGAISIQ